MVHQDHYSGEGPGEGEGEGEGITEHIVSALLACATSTIALVRSDIPFSRLGVGWSLVRPADLRVSCADKPINGSHLWADAATRGLARGRVPCSSNSTPKIAGFHFRRARTGIRVIYVWINGVPRYLPTYLLCRHVPYFPTSLGLLVGRLGSRLDAGDFSFCSLTFFLPLSLWTFKILRPPPSSLSVLGENASM